MNRFEGRVALVTGAGRGIGRATALRLAAEGAAVAVADLNGEWAQAVAAEIDPRGESAIAVQADVASEEGSAHMVRACTERLGRLDVLVNNAGISQGAPVAEMEAARWDQVIRVNLRGVFLGCRAAIPALIAAGGGAIVNMSSSMAEWDAYEDGAAYMASKAGVSSLTRSLALQLGRDNIRVNAVCPGIIRSRLNFQPGMSESAWEAEYERFAARIPLRRVGRPEDVAAAIAFLASDDARHISGSLLLIDGGQTLQSWSNAPE